MAGEGGGSNNGYLDGDLVGLLDEVLFVCGLVPLEAILELLDLLGHDGVLADVGAVESLLLEGDVGAGLLVVHGRQCVRCVGHGGGDLGWDPRVVVRMANGIYTNGSLWRSGIDYVPTLTVVW